ncbi:MAG: hypothetical protein WAN59_00615 [Candidatus Baltobacteraceae bacterium]
MKFRDSSGATLTIAKKLGEGGEGVVFTTNEKKDVVAKIYSHPLSKIQIAKLEEMVHAADDTLGSVAAWPTSMLYKDARAVGFTMPMLTSQHPLHDLFGPKRRQALFPNAHWSFLVHTGINLSRAFEVLHDRNIVVGDVNSNNVVVYPDSTARLIDCDSFQIQGKGKLFRCNVGVAEYQPPELQGRDFSRIERLPQHDLFGLAVMIFQLLFVGKHPFAGVLPAETGGAAPIGANVAARRFFYGQEGRRQGLRPPPGSLTLTAITPQLSTLFRNAFLGDTSSRPSAAAWRGALADLKSKTVVCRANPLHHYLRNAACPWCALERGGLYYFSGLGSVSGIDESIWQSFSNADVERTWSEIDAVKPPPALDPVIAPARRCRPARLSLWSKRRKGAYVAGAVATVAAVAALAHFNMPAIAVYAALAALVLGVVFRPDARAVATQRWQRHSNARRAFRAAEQSWARAAKATPFFEERERLARARRALLDQRSRYESELAGLRANRERKERDAILRRHRIAACNIPEITWQIQEMLRNAGVETAADLSFERLEGFPGLWRPAKYYLLAWRMTIERRIRLNPRMGLDAELVRELRAAHLRERAQNQKLLLGGAASLRRIATEIQCQRAGLKQHAQACAEALWQAEADADGISPLLYWTTSF